MGHEGREEERVRIRADGGDEKVIWYVEVETEWQYH